MKKIFLTQIIILIGGTLFAWYTVVLDFMKFYGFEGTLVKINDCIIPNPVTTPCFWGSWAFLIALIWSIYIYRMSDTSQQRKHQRNLVLFLIAGVIFAWTNFTLGFIKFLENQGKPVIGCSGQLMSNPYTTPCFIGACIFLLALIIGIVLFFSVKKATAPVPPAA